MQLGEYSLPVAIDKLPPSYSVLSTEVSLSDSFKLTERLAPPGSNHSHKREIVWKLKESFVSSNCAFSFCSDSKIVM